MLNLEKHKAMEQTCQWDTRQKYFTLELNSSLNKWIHTNQSALNKTTGHFLWQKYRELIVDGNKRPWALKNDLR